MIQLAFDVDASEIAQDLSADPLNAHPGVVEETYFLAPVTFVVDGRNLLAIRGMRHRLPVLGFATDMLEALNQLRPNEERQVALAGGGSLTLRVMPPNVEIASSLTKERVVVESQELIRAFRRFAATVQHELLRQMPTLRAHRNWNRWFPADLDIDL
jgi:hypothetical protein